MTGRGSTCRRCVHYRSAGLDGNGEFGECRINPPILFRDGAAVAVGEGWPRIGSADWCGRFAAKPDWSAGSEFDSSHFDNWGTEARGRELGAREDGAASWQPPALAGS
jgi:hypothetical protein